jgi:hypothetical protein
MKSNLRNEIKSYIIRQGMTMQEVVDLLRDEHGWSDSVSNLSNKLQRESCAMSKLSSLPMRWGTRLSGRGGSEEDVHMTDTEKKLLQAQHRLEEAQARDRVKERKARTRRLIQEGAILEKVLPEIQAIELSELEGYLSRKLGKQI